MIPIISIVGRTNSGKTTLVERIIPEFKKRGYRVGAIKHDVHEFEIDHEGKDTFRMSSAGADTVVIASNEKMAMVKSIDHEYTIDEMAAWLFPDVDIVITEGFKKQDKPKIEVTNTGELLCSKENNLIAVVDNTQQGKQIKLSGTLKDVACIRMEDAEKIVDIIEKDILCEMKK